MDNCRSGTWKTFSQDEEREGIHGLEGVGTRLSRQRGMMHKNKRIRARINVQTCPMTQKREQRGCSRKVVAAVLVRSTPYPV